MSTPESTRNYGGRSVADRRADRRVRFLDAALTVFATKSYANSTISDICAGAGLSRRQFYEEFGGRQEVLVALYDEIQRDAGAAIAAGFESASPADLWQAASTVMTAYVTSIGTDARRAKIAFVEIVGVSEEVERHRLAQRAQWGVVFESLLGQLVGADVHPPGGYEMSATAFIGAVNGLVHQWSITEPRPPVTDLVEVLSTILVALVSERPTAR
ncbi:TetR/AcrR family transcriptional regulator [Rhodococcus sp. NPDC059234]|uniref:TetR/AcrR family transcriptional regulator n=1 Tax=Rhodococcus sp. NPDC059234 TaxID=3346781 RepID=UPI00366E06AF